MQKLFRFIILCSMHCMLPVLPLEAADEQAVVHHAGSADELDSVLKRTQPGDTVLLRSGEWRDVELRVHAVGTPLKPIRIAAETAGSVILSGQSSLGISGRHLIIEGLVFRDGHTPGSEVISFRTRSGVYAEHCRLTQCVIDNYNHPERSEAENWVVLYGKRNRVDHCYFNDKRGAGVTLVVRLIDEGCQENGHLIDHNYFGYRQNLGSNGGETIRIGTSAYSMAQSQTRIEGNTFDRCSGETEIISIKSCGNEVSGNLFHHCQGSVVFRHGNGNRVEDNWFVGGGLPNTGGIRVINQYNRVIRNRFEGLAGRGFRAALVLMNGVPNSPINRYHQVIGAEVCGNIFEDCAQILLGAGSDAERTLPPVESRFTGNRLIHAGKEHVIVCEDVIDGILFSENQYEGILKVPEFERTLSALEVEAPCGKPEAAPGVESMRDSGAIGFYGFRDPEMRFGEGERLEVKPGEDTLFEAVRRAKAGDVLELKPGAVYRSEKTIEVRVPLTIRASKDGPRPVLFCSKATLFAIENGGGLELTGLELNGAEAPDQAGNRLIRTSRYSMNRNYRLRVEGCLIRDLNVNHSFDFFYAHPSTMADAITLENCDFRNISGSVLALDNEPEELGLYNAEAVVVAGCNFESVELCAIRLARRGSDESTSGPYFVLNHAAFRSVGLGKRNRFGAIVDLHGAQGVRLESCRFEGMLPVKIHHTNGAPEVLVRDCFFESENGLHCNAPGLRIENPAAKSGI
jgi:poly(beta-D-mannuronate) lyase